MSPNATDVHPDRSAAILRLTVAVSQIRDRLVQYATTSEDETDLLDDLGPLVVELGLAYHTACRAGQVVN